MQLTESGFLFCTHNFCQNQQVLILYYQGKYLECSLVCQIYYCFQGTKKIPQIFLMTLARLYFCLLTLQKSIQD